MLKPRVGQRAAAAEQAASSGRTKTETLSANGTGSQQSAAQARKRRSSINVYDQPSSLNSRLRQLETDMLRLDEDRNRLVDETHASLAQYELKLSEIHAIIKSRQDNVDRYVEDMRILLQAKDEFEKQAKLLNEKHDRIHEKFMHRETIISREIKLLKNKFDALEKNRQFRTMLQKSGTNSNTGDASNADDLNSGLDGSAGGTSRKRSETGTNLTGSELDSFGPPGEVGDEQRQLGAGGSAASGGSGPGKKVRIKMPGILGNLFQPMFRFGSRRTSRGPSSRRGRRKSNKVSSIVAPSDSDAANEELKALITATGTTSNSNQLTDSTATTPQAAAEAVALAHTDGSEAAPSAGPAEGETPLSSQLVNSSTTSATGADKNARKKPSSFLGKLFRTSS